MKEYGEESECYGTALDNVVDVFVSDSTMNYRGEWDEHTKFFLNGNPVYATGFCAGSEVGLTIRENLPENVNFRFDEIGYCTTAVLVRPLTKAENKTYVPEGPNMQMAQLLQVEKVEGGNVYFKTTEKIAPFVEAAEEDNEN